jgi:hypothetical protein
LNDVLGDLFGSADDLLGVVVGVVVIGLDVDHLGSFDIEIYTDPEARITSSNSSFLLRPLIVPKC